MIPVPGAPPAPYLICYEIIFPGAATAQSEEQGGRPGWIINLTNDGWLGVSSGPYQHFQQARVRAIEEGLPLVYTANTGISAVVDPLGRIIDALPLGAEGIIDAPLPQPITAPIYTRVGDVPAAMMVAIALMMLIRRRLQPNSAKFVLHRFAHLGHSAPAKTWRKVLTSKLRYCLVSASQKRAQSAAAADPRLHNAPVIQLIRVK